MRREYLSFAIVSWTVLATAPAAATQSLRFRFDPPVGRVLQIVTRTEGATKIRVGAPDSAALDSIVFEHATLTAVTRRVVERRGDAAVVEATLDSEQTRTRVPGGPWRHGSDSVQTRGGLRMVVDSRLRIRDIAPLGDDSLSPAQRQQLRGFVGGFEAALPDGSVSVSERWSADLVFPLDVPTDYGSETGLGAAIRADSVVLVRATVTLDSIVPRPTDTLGYVEIEGTILPASFTADEAMQKTPRLAGGIGGSLIWSTGWEAFVAGAVRTRASIVRSPGGGVASGVTLTFDALDRFRVRQ